MAFPRKRTYKKKATTKVSKPLKLAIQRAVKASAPEEVKYITTWNGQSASADVWGIGYNAFMTGPTNEGIMPAISQGTGVGQRIGNKICPKRLTVDFWVNPANLTSSVDMIARMLILESKNIRDGAAATAITLGEVLNFGQTQGSFNGYTSHLKAPINTNLFKVHSDRLIKFNKAQGNGPTLSNAYVGDVVSPTSTNNMAHYRVNIKVPKTFTYKEAADVFPEGFCPFFNCGYAVLPSTNGTDTPDVTILRLQVQWSVTLYYTDA